MNTDIFKQVGLSNGEVMVYTVLLQNGSLSTNTIHEHTGIERRNIYDILNKLIQRGFVTYIHENKRRLFQATHPKRIIGYLEEQQDDIEQTKQEVVSQLETLTALFKAKKPRIHGEIFRGTEGIKAVWEDMLNYKENYFIAAGRYVPVKLPRYFASFNRRRIEKKIRWVNLLTYELRGKTKQMPYEKIKFLPKDFSGFPNVVFIYGNKAANVLLGDDFFAFVMESEEVVESHKKFHKYLWDVVALPYTDPDSKDIIC